MYSLFVIRLSLDYLGKEEYGLLSLLAQIAAYIAVLDLGLTIAFGRILIDYTNGSKELYAKALRTASLVFNILGLTGFLIAAVIALVGTMAFAIPERLGQTFTYLMLAQGVVIFATFSLKALSAPLIANGKHHVLYWVATAIFLVNGLLFWLCLRYGFGIYSIVIGQVVGLALLAGLLWRFSVPYHVIDYTNTKFDRRVFKEVFSFAKDTMIWQIGGQTMASLPILLASAWFALNATADIAAGLKLVILAISVCTRFGDMSVTPLSIEYARGNEAAAARQMKRIAGIAGGVGVCAALFTTCVNPSFLNWWMLGKISWSWHANLSAAIWIAILTVTQCLYGYAIISRQLKLIRWALLAECVVYLVLAAIGRKTGDPSALLWAKPIATLAIGIYVALRIRKHTGFDTSLLLAAIYRQSFVMILLLAAGVPLSRYLGDLNLSPFMTFLANSLLASGLILIALPFIFTKDMRDDFLRIVRNIITKFPRIGSTPSV